MKKIIASILLVLVLSTQVFAAEDFSTVKNYIQVDKIRVSVDYSMDEIQIERRDTNTGKIVYIYDNDGNLLETIEEIIVDDDNNISTSSCGQESERDILRTFYEGNFRVTVRAYCTVYDECNSSENRTHVTRVHNVDMFLSSSGFADLTNDRAIIIGTTRVQCTGVITVILDTKVTGEAELSIFENAGFRITGEVGGRYKLRKDFNKIIDF